MTYGPPFILSVITGGVKLTRLQAKAMKKAGLPVQDDMLMATISERLRAIELLAKLGPGFRLDRTVEDEVPRRGVVFLPAADAEWDDDWDELPPHEMPVIAAPKAKGNGRRRAKGNGAGG